MVNKCSAFGCKSGYGENCDSVRVTFHSFPLDEHFREKWIRANPRKDFKPSAHSRMCSLHFKDSDFIEERADKKSRRLKKFTSTQLKKRYLRTDAVPCIFPNAPTYFSTPTTVTHRASAA